MIGPTLCCANPQLVKRLDLLECYSCGREQTMDGEFVNSSEWDERDDDNTELQFDDP